MKRGAAWPAIPPGAWQSSDEGQLGISGRLFDQLPGDAAERNLDPALPTGVGLSGELSNVDVDEATIRRPLYQRAKKVRQHIIPIVLGRHRAIEAQVVAPRS